MGRSCRASCIGLLALAAGALAACGGGADTSTAPTTIVVSGTRDVGGGVTLVLTGAGQAVLGGTAAYDGTTLTMEGQPSGTSHGENPYRSVVLAMLSSVERVSLTPVAGTFC